MRYNITLTISNYTKLNKPKYSSDFGTNVIRTTINFDIDFTGDMRLAAMAERLILVFIYHCFTCIKADDQIIVK